MSSLSLTGQVAIVTGAGRGIGRQHALALAARGARVLVNDLGTAVDGTGRSPGPARTVAQEITDRGGAAVHDNNTVATQAGGEAIVGHALAEFGRVDIVVNNAGTAHASPFEAMAEEAFESQVDVHLMGAFHVTRPAWQVMQSQQYGRVVNTTSGVGLFGLREAAGYAAAKMGVVGLTRALALEGRGRGISVNAIAPVAATRMAGDTFGPLAPALDPALISAAVVWLAHRDCSVTGEILSVGGGRVARIVIGVTRGYFNTCAEPEDVRDHCMEILDEVGVLTPDDALAEVRLIAALHAGASEPLEKG